MQSLHADGIRLDLLREINLNHVASFLAVAGWRSFRAAAEVLFISQSSLSVQIQQLEESLGVTLFQRTTRSVELTREAARLLPSMRLAAGELARVLGEFREESALRQGSVSLAAIPSTMSSVVAPLLQALAARHPGILASVTVLASSNAVADSVRRGEADVGLLNFSEDLNELAFTTLFDDAFVALVSKDEPALATREEVTLADLAAFPMLAQPAGTSIRSALDAHLREQQVAAEVRIEVLHVESLAALAGAGLGVTVLPQGAVAPLNLASCRVLRLRGVAPRRVGLALSERRSVSPATALVRRLLRELHPAP